MHGLLLKPDRNDRHGGLNFLSPKRWPTYESVKTKLRHIDLVGALASPRHFDPDDNHVRKDVAARQRLLRLSRALHRLRVSRLGVSEVLFSRLRL